MNNKNETKQADVRVTVSRSDKERYNITHRQINKDYGQATTEDDVKRQSLLMV